MRKTLNENPVVQVVMLGILGIIVAFLFMTRVMGGNEAADPAAAPAATAAADPVSAPTTTPVATTPAAPVTSTSPAAPISPTSSEVGFETGPGLPAAVVDAHESGDVVALLVSQNEGIEDKKLRTEVEALRGRSDTTVFVTTPGDLTRYSRIAEGVNLDRVPALVVIHPPAGKGESAGLPVASISYGYRGPDAVRQAINDALYDGKDLPYHPG